jgi:hypothetical protein
LFADDGDSFQKGVDAIQFILVANTSLGNVSELSTGNNGKQRSRVSDEKFQEMAVIIQITTFSVASCFQNCKDRKK